MFESRPSELSIAFDPMLGRWVGGVRRAVEPGLGLGDFADVRLVLISHRHADHLHIPTLRRLPRAATVVVPSGVATAWDTTQPVRTRGPSGTRTRQPTAGSGRCSGTR